MTPNRVLAESAPATTADAPRYTLLVAAGAAEIRAAQRLRYRVFAEEMGATLRQTVPGHDADEFDAVCDHLIVRDERTGEAVGTYRMLPPGRAGRLYSDTEFDLSALAGLRDAVVETGRSCVHPDHRTGAVINLVWTGIARYMLLSGYRWLAGCASVGLHDGGVAAAGVWDTVRARYYSPEEYRVRPLNPWDHSAVTRTGRPELPPLLRGYLRLGAWVCGEPAHDPDFGVADLFVLLSLDRVNARYLKHFLGERSR